MKYIFSCLFLLTFIISCTPPKLQFNQLHFYYGNTALPPPYQESLSVRLDTTSTSIKTTKGQQKTVNNFNISPKMWKKIICQAQNLTSQKTDLGPFQEGGAIYQLVLSQTDSLVYSLKWQAHQKVSKAHKKIAITLRKLTPAIGGISRKEQIEESEPQW